MGLDLGSGNSCVAVIEGGKPVVVVNEEGNRTTPSVVQINGDEVKVGNGAKRAMVTNPKNTVSFVKRFMGAEYKDDDVQKMLSMVTYDVVNKSNKPYISIDGKEYSPEQVSSMIVSKMKKIAEDYVGDTITDAVITVPAWFGDAARTATKTAGELAGLNVLRVINEPTSASLASDLMADGKDKTVVVVDSGAGTLDVSVLEFTDGMAEVLASNGDVFLGGQNYDNAIVDWICDEFKKSDDVDLKKDTMAYARVVEAAEKAKIELSNSTQTEINLPYISIKDNKPLNLVLTLTRAKFESLVKEFNDRTIEKAKEAVKKAGKAYTDIDCILLVGGTTRIPSLQEALKKEFSVPLNQSVNPDEAVALGAAKQASILVGETTGDLLLLDCTPLSLGIETRGDLMTTLVEANTTIPCQKKEVFTTSVDNQTMVEINVLQGERPIASGNKSIGRFRLEGIPMAKAGVPKVEVTFDVDANGILTVSAKDTATNKEQRITITNNSLSDDEIKQIRQDADKFKAADEKKRKETEELNGAEAYMFNVKEMIVNEDFVKKTTDEERAAAQEKLDTLESVLVVKDKDHEKIVEAKKALEDVWNPLIKKFYESGKDKPQDAPAQENLEEKKEEKQEDPKVDINADDTVEDATVEDTPTEE